MKEVKDKLIARRGTTAATLSTLEAKYSEIRAEMERLNIESTKIKFQLMKERAKADALDEMITDEPDL